MGQHVVSQKGGDGPPETKFVPMLVVTSRPWEPSTVAVPASWSIPVQRWCRWEPVKRHVSGSTGARGQPSVAQTANGMVRAWRVTLDSVRVGDVTINGVDGLVRIELPIVLLGMSFLSRTEMRNEGRR